MILTCPNRGELIPLTAHTSTIRKPRTHSHTEPNDREFARHLKRVRQIEEQEPNDPYPDLLQDL